ncbi:MAG TPA: CDP-alcohol phosphatidyltransferase family protein, partial [Solirubrobacteraceae bacterium]|nr:CDP-alcohol phosphatidyltransferase family protein [Solirubrobacteraceae bacterium]
MFTRFAHVPASLLALTLGRLLLVPVIIVSFDVVPLVTTAALAIFIAADLYDGVLARQLDADDTARRTLDTLV